MWTTGVQGFDPSPYGPYSLVMPCSAPKRFKVLSVQPPLSWWRCLSTGFIQWRIRFILKTYSTVYDIALHYTVLCYVILLLCCIILYYTILYYVILYYVLLCDIVSDHVMLCYVLWCYIILHCIIFNSILFYYIILYYIILYYIVLYCIINMVVRYIYIYTYTCILNIVI